MKLRVWELLKVNDLRLLLFLSYFYFLSQVEEISSVSGHVSLYVSFASKCDLRKLDGLRQCRSPSSHFTPGNRAQIHMVQETEWAPGPVRACRCTGSFFPTPGFQFRFVHSAASRSIATFFRPIDWLSVTTLNKIYSPSETTSVP